MFYLTKHEQSISLSPWNSSYSVYTIGLEAIFHQGTSIWFLRWYFTMYISSTWEETRTEILRDTRPLMDWNKKLCIINRLIADGKVRQHVINNWFYVRTYEWFSNAFIFAPLSKFEIIPKTKVKNDKGKSKNKNPEHYQSYSKLSCFIRILNLKGNAKPKWKLVLLVNCAVCED